MKKYVYMFPEGNGKMRELLGGKGANLAEMTGLGMPVPQGFTITTEPAPVTTRTARLFIRIFRIRFWSTSISLKRLPAKPSAIPRSRCSYPFARVHAHPCPA